MTSITARTPGPWAIGTKVRSAIYGADDSPICICDGMGEHQLDKANAASIVRAVNAHDQLVTALKELLQYLDDHDWGLVPEGETAVAARAALAAAGAA